MLLASQEFIFESVKACVLSALILFVPITISSLVVSLIQAIFQIGDSPFMQLVKNLVFFFLIFFSGTFLLDLWLEVFLSLTNLIKLELS